MSEVTPCPCRAFRRFTGLNELIDWLKNNDYVWYQGPMDSEPVNVLIASYTISHRSFVRSRAMLFTRATGNFSVGLAAHLDRFSLEVQSNKPSSDYSVAQASEGALPS
jgi:hypothetical protein